MGRKQSVTKFPAARIKKIMQVDEEVGKLANAVPVMVGRAVEMFLESLVQATLVEARLLNPLANTAANNTSTPTETNSSGKLGAGAKRKFAGKSVACMPFHFKRCVEKNPQFDFLRSLADGIPDESFVNSRVSESDQQASPGTLVAQKEKPRKRKQTAKSAKSSAAATPQDTPDISAARKLPITPAKQRPDASSDSENAGSIKKPIPVSTLQIPQNPMSLSSLLSSDSNDNIIGGLGVTLAPLVSKPAAVEVVSHGVLEEDEEYD